MKTPDDYLAAYKKLHSGEAGFLVQGKEYPPSERLFDGSNFVNKLLKPFDLIIRDFDRAVRVLDWGCGKADHLHRYVGKSGKTLPQLYAGWIQEYYCYDPGNELYDKPPHWPAKYDIVICADVMEHVPAESVAATLEHMSYVTDESSCLLFTISGRLAKKQFLDGENLHCNPQDSEYWEAMLEKHLPGRAIYLLHEGNTHDTTWKNVAWTERAPRAVSRPSRREG